MHRVIVIVSGDCFLPTEILRSSVEIAKIIVGSYLAAFVTPISYSSACAR